MSAKKVNKAAKGHFKKADVAPKKHPREFRLDDISAMNVGDILKADVFAAGDKVDVTGTSKGKGYQGVIKRFGQHRLRESHGTGPVAVMPVLTAPPPPLPCVQGQASARPHGRCAVTVQNLSVVKVDAENNLIAIPARRRRHPRNFKAKGSAALASADSVNPQKAQENREESKSSD